MFVIGITGSFSSGKSTVARFFARWGAQVIDADKIAHRLLVRPGDFRATLLEAFGSGIGTKGRIDRKKLGAVVFADARKRKKLERLIHPAVIREIRDQLDDLRSSASASSIVVLDVPLLFETGLQTAVDKIVVVASSRERQCARAKEKFQMNKKEALRRIQAQMSLRHKIRLADFVIHNNQTIKETKEQARKIWHEIRQMKRS